MWSKFKKFWCGVWDFWVHDLGSTLRDSDDYVSLPRLLWFMTSAMMAAVIVAVLLGWTTEHMDSITTMLSTAFATGATAYVGKKGADVWRDKIHSATKAAVEAVVGKDDKDEEEQQNGDV